jgi:hypothetical protein
MGPITPCKCPISPVISGKKRFQQLIKYEQPKLDMPMTMFCMQNVWRNCGGRARERKLKQESTYFILEKSVAKFNPKVLFFYSHVYSLIFDLDIFTLFS